MATTNFGSFFASVPEGWAVGEDEEDPQLIAIYPPNGDAALQISTYDGPAGHRPSPEELWDFAQPFDPKWGVTRTSIRSDRGGFALDAEGPTETGGAALQAFRLWPGRLLLATFYYSDDAAHHVEAARQFISTLRPSRDIAPH